MFESRIFHRQLRTFGAWNSLIVYISSLNTQSAVETKNRLIRKSFQHYYGFGYLWGLDIEITPILFTMLLFTTTFLFTIHKQKFAMSLNLACARGSE